ncbi:hypothetical protein ACVXHA_29640 [Escherichia coli]
MCAITDEAKIAMASEDAGDSDNRNGQALLNLQSNSKTVAVRNPLTTLMPR